MPFTPVADPKRDTSATGETLAPLSFVMAKWVNAQSDIHGSYPIKLSCVALTRLLQLGDPRLLSLAVMLPKDEMPLVKGAGAQGAGTRSKGLKERHPPVPVQLGTRMLTVLSRSMLALKEEAEGDEDSGDEDDWDEEDNSDDEYDSDDDGGGGFALREDGGNPFAPAEDYGSESDGEGGRQLCGGGGMQLSDMLGMDRDEFGREFDLYGDEDSEDEEEDDEEYLEMKADPLGVSRVGVPSSLVELTIVLFILRCRVLDCVNTWSSFLTVSRAFQAPNQQSCSKCRRSPA